MIAAVARFFDSGGMMPHGHCYLWRTDLVAAHVIADSVIGIAYYSIPVALFVFVQRRRDLAFDWMFLLFAVFIFACGTTHFFDVWTLWHPDYGAQALVKVATAAVSIATAVALWPLLPRALRLPSPELLSQTNARLEREAAEREAAQMRLTELNRELESRVAARTAELERSNRDLEQFAHVASHDLREPLRTATALLQLLERRAGERLTPDLSELLTRAAGANLRLREMVEQLLEFSRAGRGADEDEPRTFADVVTEVSARVDADLRAVAGTIVVAALPNVRVRPTLLTSVLQNLLSNAIKYRGDRPLRVAISATLEGPMVRVCVADNGVGIAPEHHERVFRPFERLHTRDDIPGTGMGLAICRRIVESWRGRITVDSVAGGGATFCFTVPAEPLGTGG